MDKHSEKYTVMIIVIISFLIGYAGYRSTTSDTAYPRHTEQVETISP